MKISKNYLVLLLFLILNGCENSAKIDITKDENVTKETKSTKATDDKNITTAVIEKEIKFSYKIAHTFRGHKKNINSMALKNTILASGDEEGRVKLWDIENKKYLKEFFYLKSKAITALEFFNNQNYLITASSDFKLNIWDIEKKKIIKSTTLIPTFVTSIKISSDDLSIYVGCDDGKVRIYNNSLKNIKTIKAHNSSITSIDISKDSRYLITASLEKSAKIWDLSSLKNIKTLNHLKGVNRVATLNNTFLSAGEDSKIAIYNLNDDNTSYITSHTKGVTNIVFTNKNDYLISTSKDNSIKLSTIKEAKTLFSIFSQKDINSLVIGDDDSYIIYNSGKLIRVVEIEEE